MRIGVNEFVKRQVVDSSFSHFEGTWEELAELTNKHFDNNEQGYKDGVLLVNVPSEKFKSALIKVTEETKLIATCKPRQEGEMPVIVVEALEGEKSQAKLVQVILYRKDVLTENNEDTTDCDWEIVCFNAFPTEEIMPMSPNTMMRNYLHLEGGTKGDFSSEDFAWSIYHSNRYVNLAQK